jgi:ferredoxin--NADP+ reductase
MSGQPERDDGPAVLPSRPLRVAVVGAGPAGIYAADHLTADPRPGEDPALPHGAVVDLFERLPVPFGLLRYGVAPDHVNIKSTGRALGAVLARPAVHLFGNVEVGRDLTAEELEHRYDAVVYALGASEDRALGIPGEALPGSASATAFVNWYNGHPDSEHPDVGHAESIAVIGVGNVAVDVARILLRDPEELASTDVPQDVLDALRRSRVREVHLLGRRGPQHAKFTTRELRELGELSGVAVVLDDGQLPDEHPEGASAVTTRNLAVLRGWAGRDPADAPRRLHLHFGARPVEVLGEDRVTGLRLERASQEGAGTGQTWDLAVDAVLRAVGYRAAVPDGLPFDEARSVIPTQAHRMLRDGAVVPGVYAVGWVKRGPIGIIGTNRSDAKDTVATVLADAPALVAGRGADPGGAADLLAARGIRHVDVDGWLQVVAAEAAHGRPHGRGEVKISDWQTLLDAAWEGATDRAATG